MTILRGYEPKKVFYFGESVLEKGYRGRGLSVKFFEEREAHVRGLGGFEWTTFCVVQRPQNHPRRPKDYVPLDAFWVKRGYPSIPSWPRHSPGRSTAKTKSRRSQ
ncbi:MAG: hypothetical protein ACREUQ_01095 [Burkholderiales bacterium]